MRCRKVGVTDALRHTASQVMNGKRLGSGVAEGGYSYRLDLDPPDCASTPTLASQVRLVLMHAATGRAWQCTEALQQWHDGLEAQGLVKPSPARVLTLLTTAARQLNPQSGANPECVTCSCLDGSLTYCFR
jgi:hypothetical protein